MWWLMVLAYMELLVVFRWHTHGYVVALVVSLFVGIEYLFDYVGKPAQFAQFCLQQS